jgi:REP element-mobilizing transposase RayT
MARKPRLEFEGAIYHIINRGNYRDDVFGTKGAAEAFEKALFEAAEKSHWVIHDRGQSEHLIKTVIDVV